MNLLNLLIEHAPPLIIALPLLGAFCTPLIGKIGEKARSIFVMIIIGITGFLISLLTSDVFTHGTSVYVFGAKNLSLPVVRILFEVDSMSIFMIIITILLAVIAMIYSLSFMKGNDGLDKFYTLSLLLVASTLGMELTGDLFNFFVFLEITCISSCALIAFYIHRGEALEASFKYIVISSIGALFVLFAIGLLYAQYNALNIATIANLLQYTFLDKVALVLLLVVLGMKAGLVPMHMWLPDSYGEAPPAVTLMIIGATQASIYGILRICFTLYGNVFHQTITTSVSPTILASLVIGLALLTIFIGVIMALIQTDFTRLIAYAAVAEVGYIILGAGVGLFNLGSMTAATTGYGTIALRGGIFHIFNDTLDIGLLFLVAGAVYLTTKERSLDKLGGLARQMKYTTVFFIIGLLAVAGMPPMNGFVSKLLIYESTFQLNPLIAIIAILGSILLLAVFVKVFYAVFLGPQLTKYSEIKEAPKSLLIAMGIIASLIIIIGLFPTIFLEKLVVPAAHALIDHASYISVALMGGI